MTIDAAPPKAIEVGAAPSLYRDPGDVLQLVALSVTLLAAVVLAALVTDVRLGHGGEVIPGIGPTTTVGHVLVGAAQAVSSLATIGVIAVLVQRRLLFRLLELLGAALVAALLAWLVVRLGHVAQGTAPETSWVAPTWSLSPALAAGSMALAVGAATWLPSAWRRTPWMALTGAGIVRVLTGTTPHLEMIVALAVGATVGTGARVLFGSPDRRIGPDAVGDALRSNGLAVTTVAVAAVSATGSRPFLVRTEDHRQLFVKVVGAPERSANLLFRLYRFARLRGVGDTRPASSLTGAIEHEALVGLMAEQRAVRVPHVDRVATAADGSGLMVMELIEGQSLDRWAPADISDVVLAGIWQQVAHLHEARIAHRSLHPTNIVVDHHDDPWLIDFSFAQLTASDRVLALDVAELLMSLAVHVGPERSVRSAVTGVGPEAVAAAVPLLQPLALSASTRRLLAGHDDLLRLTRTAAAEASGQPSTDLAQLQRVRLRTLLTIAVATAAFYVILPQLAQVGGSWRAFASADLVWIVPLIALSILTYAAGAFGIMGSVPERLPFGPTMLTQFASSFVNRISPANVGGMALNARYLEKAGVDSATSVAAVGVNALVGGIVHVALTVIFFTLAGSGLTKAFKLPSSSKLLLILALVIAVAGALFATRWGRRRVVSRLAKSLRSALSNLRQVAASPTKLLMLVGGSAALTLLYITALFVATKAFDSDVGIAKIGAVYLGAAAIAAAAPTPGGLGAIEAALVAGLTGVGLESGPAVSIVLTYRLATYWLPVAPGWVAWHLLQRWEYV